MKSKKEPKINIQDIIECLGSTDEIMFWTIKDINEVVPKYREEEINQVLADNPEIFEYLPGKGWRLREPDWD